MKTKTWPELWPMQRKIAAEAAHSLAAKALAEAVRALERIDHAPSARCVALQGQINEEHRRCEDGDAEQDDLSQAKLEQLQQALYDAETEHEEARPARLAALEEAIACRTAALDDARCELDHVKLQVAMAHDANAPGPIYSFGSLGEAARSIGLVDIEKNQLGEAYAQVGRVRIRLIGDAMLSSIPPPTLRWVPNSHPSEAVALSPANKKHVPVVYIEESDEILVGKDYHRYAEVFGSLENALHRYADELSALRSIDLADEKPLPLLGEIIRDTCRKVATTPGRLQFIPGQGRLSVAQIDKLIGAYWQALINAPWEASIAGSYALLKHRCARGETPNVFACETHGHFGFRVRTPDHDWIMGEVYCPPEHFSPAKLPEPEVINRSLGPDWVAELGPVKFLIRGKTSRS